MHMQKVDIKGQTVRKLDWKQADGPDRFYYLSRQRGRTDTEAVQRSGGTTSVYCVAVVVTAGLITGILFDTGSALAGERHGAQLNKKVSLTKTVINKARQLSCSLVGIYH